MRITAGLVSDFQKQFRVGPPDREPPDPQTWQFGLPARKTREALELRFPEPLEQALLARLLWVVDSTGERVAGEVSTGREETAWFFRPRTEWQPGDYSVEIGLVLEDLAGNAIGQPFEVDVFERVQPQVSPSALRLPFVIR